MPLRASHRPGNVAVRLSVVIGTLAS